MSEEGMKEAALDGAIDEVAALLKEDWDGIWSAMVAEKNLRPKEKEDDIFSYSVSASVKVTSDSAGYGVYATLSWAVKQKDESQGVTVTDQVPDRELGLPDDLVNEAKAIIVEITRASTSALQRRLKIGYTRAARIMDLLEEAGVVGPPRGSDPREILIDLGEDES